MPQWLRRDFCALRRQRRSPNYKVFNAQLEEKMSTAPFFTVPTLDREVGARVAAILQARLHALNELHLTLKHAHWNVVGPNFIAVHEMLDPQVDAVRLMVDEIAERIAALGVIPDGTLAGLAAAQGSGKYPVGRGAVAEHLSALDAVYTEIVSAHRRGVAESEQLDAVSSDVLFGHLAELEKFHWFIRAHLANSAGKLGSA